MKRLIYFLRTGHWPKRFRYPHGVPRVSVWDIPPFNYGWDLESHIIRSEN